MKIRTDFVTNSSGSSFILARNSELNKKQEKAIIQFVKENFLGIEVLTPESSEEEIQKVFKENFQVFLDESSQQEVREALKSGKSIYSDWVSFEDDYEYAEIFEKIWKIMEENGDGNFVAIDDDLSY